MKQRIFLRCFSFDILNGKLLLISNVTNTFSFDSRTNLQIQISNDNGNTWQFLCHVDNKDKALFYPHTAVDDKNKILYVSYEDGVCHYLNKYTFEELGLAE